ncbi:MAG: enoyl-CoA hydratase-related protein, partial [Chloroflexota bacterium]
LYLTGQRFGAEVAMRTGLVHWIAPVQELEIAIDERIADVLACGPGATREAKRLIAELDGLDDGAMRDLTSRRIATLRAAPEGQEGLRAFLEKRRPDWHGGS